MWLLWLIIVIVVVALVARRGDHAPAPAPAGGIVAVHRGRRQ